VSESLVDQHPKMVEWEERRADLKRAEDVHRQRVEDLMEPYEAARAAWETEARQAVAEGRTPPDEPQAPILSVVDRDAPHAFLQRHQQLDAERRQLLAAIASDIKTEAEAVIRDVLAKAKASAKAIAGHTEHLQAVLRDLAQVRREDPVRIDAGDVVEAALGHRPLVAPPPSPYGPEDPVRQGIIENASAEGYGEAQPHVRAGFIR
jgi:hypothetical protein